VPDAPAADDRLQQTVTVKKSLLNAEFALLKYCV